MPRDVDIFQPEISAAIEKILNTNKTIIPRRLIEEEIENNRSEYPHIGVLENVPLKIAISMVVNRRSDVLIYGKRPVSWIFPSSSSIKGVAS